MANLMRYARVELDYMRISLHQATVCRASVSKPLRTYLPVRLNTVSMTFNLAFPRRNSHRLAYVEAGFDLSRGRER